MLCRTLYGVRGLKSDDGSISQLQRSHPVRGAWIEMWIEIVAPFNQSVAVASHSARGA